MRERPEVRLGCQKVEHPAMESVFSSFVDAKVNAQMCACASDKCIPDCGTDATLVFEKWLVSRLGSEMERTFCTQCL